MRRLARLLSAVVLILAVMPEPPAAATVVILKNCSYSHSLPDDPIVHPGKPGASHLHDFMGNATVDAYSTVESLSAGSSTCPVSGDKAGYWVPAAFVDGSRVLPTGMAEYWRDSGRRAPVEVPPVGMMFVAGGPGRIFWSCPPHGNMTAALKNCSGGEEVALTVVFPDCWDGAGLTPEHFTYDKACSGGRPIAQLQINVKYGIGPTVFVGGSSRLAFSSGDYTTAHADFFNAWDPQALGAAILSKLNR
jgi:Domain of unknown function (DUF1996)